MRPRAPTRRRTFLKGVGGGGADRCHLSAATEASSITAEVEEVELLTAL